LWDNKIDSRGAKQTVKMCLDATVDQKMKWWGSQVGGRSKSDCTHETVTPLPGGGWRFHAVCHMGESGTVTSDGQATGDFSSHYKVEVNSVTEGSPMAQANGAHTTTIEADWLGPCPPDMKAGDMQVGNFKFNMLAGADAAASMQGDAAKVRAEAAAGHVNPADLAKLRAQAEAMKKQMKDVQQ
ncbi:DUF3617 family protein, partial [Phenylobacterium sp.]|uniref:DUF3617 family protein n=1 Tax=Phenylobacterium sp. TaxID=1871053 RepID=UPI0011F8595B